MKHFLTTSAIALALAVSMPTLAEARGGSAAGAAGSASGSTGVNTAIGSGSSSGTSATVSGDNSSSNTPLAAGSGSVGLTGSTAVNVGATGATTSSIGNTGSTSTTTGTTASGSVNNNGALSPSGGATVSGSTSGDMSWNAQNNYWRGQYNSRPYFSTSRNYTQYEPAYRYGFDAYNRNSGRAFNELDQEQMRRGWEQARGTSKLNWNDAQLAARDSYDRMHGSRTAANTTATAR